MNLISILSKLSMHKQQQRRKHMVYGHEWILLLLRNISSSNTKMMLMINSFIDLNAGKNSAVFNYEIQRNQWRSEL